MKNYIGTAAIIFLFLTNYQTVAQEVYYKTPDGKIYNETFFKAIKEGIAKNGNIKIAIADLYTKNDSIVKEVQFSLIDTRALAGFDPYANHKKLIGTKFNIAAFKNATNVNYAKNYLEGKPTLINFWFTRCPPCVGEIPNLNNIQSQFENKVNFIAITFDSRTVVDNFLKKTNIKFEHIVDAQKQLDDLQIEAYPMSFLLDKSGKIIEVYGEISYDEKEIVEKINKILKS